MASFWTVDDGWIFCHSHPAHSIAASFGTCSLMFIASHCHCCRSVRTSISPHLSHVVSLQLFSPYLTSSRLGSSESDPCSFQQLFSASPFNTVRLNSVLLTSPLLFSCRVISTHPRSSHLMSSHLFSASKLISALRSSCELLAPQLDSSQLALCPARWSPHSSF